MEKIADRIRSGIRRLRLANHREVQITSSLGAIHYVPNKDDAQDANWLVQQADQAMYEAKRQGGDQVALYSLSSLDAPQPALV